MNKKKLTIIPLVIYWVGIFILTHVPIPHIIRKAGVSDKSLHFLAFLVLIFLIWFAISPYQKVSWRKPAIWIAIVMAVLYSALDEWLQVFVGRGPSIYDFGTNLVGVLAGVVLLTFLDFWWVLLIVSAVVIVTATMISKVNLARVMPEIYTIFHFFAYGVFALAWVQWLKHKISSFDIARLKWLFAALLLPFVLLVSIKVFSSLIGKTITTINITAALIGVFGVAATFYIDFIRRKSLSFYDSDEVKKSSTA